MRRWFLTLLLVVGLSGWLSPNLRAQRVVEELVFEVPAGEVETFLQHDRGIWTKALASCPGFLKKETWVDRKKAGRVTLVVHWETMGHWARVPKSLLKETDRAFQEAMGGKDTFKMVSVRAYDWRGEEEKPAGVLVVEEPSLTLEPDSLSDRAVLVEVPHDGVFKRAKRYRGVPVAKLLDGILKPDHRADPASWDVMFECEDGYAPTASLVAALSPTAHVAIADLDARDGEHWVQKGNGKPLVFAPAYLVWSDPDKATAKKRPWPYALARIRVVPSLARDPFLRPADEAHERGFVLFRDQCLKCHALSGIGGTMGPELHGAKNITEYWKVDQLVPFIRHPQRFRSTSRMPAMTHLGVEEVEAIVAYLQSLVNK
ncbi:MAG: TIGR03792 family protein [Verrucomicrobiota bacterium]